MRNVKKFAACFLAVVLFNSCSSLPGAQGPTDAEINAQADKAYAEVKAKSKISTNKEWNAIVQRVATRIAKASGENFHWEYVLLDSPEVNAWCMPGGKIAVYTGLLPVVKTEGALAAVLGHEVAHATLRHGKKRYARAIQENYIGAVIGIGTAIYGQMVCETERCRLLTALSGTAAGFAITFFNLKYSRGQESQADQYGQIYMAKAGYDPRESIRLWKRMEAATNGKAPPEFLSDHPSDLHREEKLESWLPTAENYYDHAPQKYGVGERID